MNRSLQIALALTLAASPVLAQRGGGGGGRGGGGGGFHGGGSAPAYHGGGPSMAPRYSGPPAGTRYVAPHYAPAPAYSGYRGNYTPGPGRPPVGVRPPNAGYRPPHYGPPNYHPPGRWPHRPYYPPFLGGYGFGSRYGFGAGWLGTGILSGFPVYGYPYYSPFDDGYNFLGDYDYTGTYDNGTYGDAAPGYAAAQPYTDPNSGYSNDYNSYPQQQQQGQFDNQQQPSSYVAPNYVAPPATPPQPALPVTLIFKDGRPPIEIRNYIATGTSVRVFDTQRRVEIPITDLDLDATFKANYQAGVDFHLPMSTAH